MRPQQRHSKRSGKHSLNYLPEFFEQRLLLSAVSAAPTFDLVRSASPTAMTAPHFPVDPALPATSDGDPSPAPGSYTPQQVESAYSAAGIIFNGNIVGNGAGQTIALVDAYDYPTARADLATFDATYDLPAPPSFQILNQEGQTGPLPTTDPAGQPQQGDDDWEGEESLDIEWAHAMAPGASLILVETDTPDSLLEGAAAAGEIRGVSVVSMSWGAAQSVNDHDTDADFVVPSTHIGVTFVASAGDSGAFESGTASVVPQYPAESPNVIAVGGTSLFLNGNSYGSESAWGDGSTSGVDGGGGGGISTNEAQPEYQHFLVTQSATSRTYPDVAMLADPATGIAVCDSYDNGPITPWSNGVGGTSLASPLFAGVIAIADQGRVANGMGTLNGAEQTLPLIYALPEADFHDVTTGDNGYAAGPGYDLATGRGSAVASLIVSDLDSPYIGFHVFSDANYNGQQDFGEGGLAGLTVELEKPGAGGIGGIDSTVVLTTTTDAGGFYAFTDVPVGTYYVHFVAPAGFFISPVGTSPLASTDSVADANGNTGLIAVGLDTDNFDVSAGMYQESISITDVTITRPHSGEAPMVFTVTISPFNSLGASIPYTTTDGTATVANDDYLPTSGTLVFPVGVTTETVTVNAVGNNIIENNVAFTVNLTIPPGDLGAKTVGIGTILNSNFSLVTIASPPPQTRSSTDSLTYAFTVSLNVPSPYDVLVPYNTADVSAVGGVDYTVVSGTLTFSAGTTGPQTIDVTVLAGGNQQLDKTFDLVLSASSTVLLGSPSVGVGTILTNSPPSISAVAGTTTESLLGLTYLPFNVDITPSLSSSVTVNYATSDGTAIAGKDYQTEAGTLTFPAGRIEETVYVPVYQQFIAAQTKTVGFTISSPTGSILIGTASVLGTIDYLTLSALPFSATHKTSYTDSLNQRVVVSLKGLGSGNVVFLGSSTAETNAYEIETNGTNGSSSLSISVAGGKQTSLTNLIVNGSIGTISAKSTNLLGTLTSSGSTNSLSLGYVSAATITIGSSSTGQSVSMAFNRVLNSTITSAIPIKTLTAGAYLNTTGSPIYITAPTVGTVKIKGTFGGTIKTTSVTSLAVSGSIDGGGIHATGTIGSITADAITNSQFFAGVNDSLTTLPTSSADFANAKSSITSIRVNGGVFSNSLIAGWNIGTVSVAEVGTISGASDFGISANHVARIRTGGIGFSRKTLQLSNPTSMTSVDNFVVDPV